MPPLHPTYYPDGTTLHLWRLDEDSTALMRCCGRASIALPQLDCCEKRLKEKLAEALLLHHIFGKQAALSHTPTGAPVINIDNCHISISHTGGWVAIAHNDSHNIGIDIERCSSRVLRVREKFLNQLELTEIQPNDIVANTIAWTAKEALYKLFGGLGGASLSGHYSIGKPLQSTHGEFITHRASAAIVPTEELAVISCIMPDAVISLATYADTIWAQPDATPIF